jgi:hypothetical protein
LGFFENSGAGKMDEDGWVIDWSRVKDAEGSLGVVLVGFLR